MSLHHKIAAIILKDKKLLMVRKENEPHFIMPGGRATGRDSKKDTLRRKLSDELNVRLVHMDPVPYGTWEAPHFRDEGKVVRMETYLVSIEGTPLKSGGIEQIAWITSAYKSQGITVASIDEDYLIPKLLKQGLID
ncbi:MAG: NUDIX domain-containing protein [archaeon]